MKIHYIQTCKLLIKGCEALFDWSRRYDSMTIRFVCFNNMPSEKVVIRPTCTCFALLHQVYVQCIYKASPNFNESLIRGFQI